jgi:HAD superfamily hydrolase (TIGR01549 family)
MNDRLSSGFPTLDRDALKAVVFDHDGTLADTGPRVVETLNHTLAALGRPSLTTKQRRLIYGPYRATLERLLPDELVDCAHKLVFEYETEHVVEVRYFDGIRELLADLQGSDRKIGLWTGRSRAGTMAMLDVHGLAGFFDKFAFGDDNAHYKPHPDGFARLVESFTAEPNEVVMVGDSPHDMDGPRIVGSPIIGVAFGTDIRDEPLREAGCPVVVETVAELRALLLGNEA